MFNYWKYRLHLHQLEKSSQKLLKQYQQAARVANKDQFDHMELNDLCREQDELQTWIQFVQTKYWQDKCNIFVIPMPEKTDENCWYKYDFDDEEGEVYILTTTGIHKARTLIRQEKKELREAFGFYFTITTGFIGALIGLVSILKSH